MSSCSSTPSSPASRTLTTPRTSSWAWATFERPPGSTRSTTAASGTPGEASGDRPQLLALVCWGQCEELLPGGVYCAQSTPALASARSWSGWSRSRRCFWLASQMPVR